MALNLSRGEPTKFYSSDRIVQLIGNGLLTFIDKKVQMHHFFNKNEIVFYSSINDLADKVIFYSKNDKARKKIAMNGKKKYFKLFGKKVMFYYMPKKTKPNPPAKIYLNKIIQGYKDCGYQNNYIVISRNKKIKVR